MMQAQQKQSEALQVFNQLTEYPIETLTELELQRLKKRALSALDSGVDSYAAYSALGVIAAFKHNYQEVDDNFKQAIAAIKRVRNSVDTRSWHNNFIVLFENYISSLRQVDRYIEANRIAKMFYEAFPRSVSALKHLAQTFEDIGMVSQALPLYEQLQKSVPNDDAIGHTISNLTKINRINALNHVDESQVSIVIDFVYRFIESEKLKLYGHIAVPQQDEYESWINYRFVLHPSEKAKKVNMAFCLKKAEVFMDNDEAFNGIIVTFEQTDASIAN
jgi:tetratricopeptide (TPR) repeat protein